MDTKRKNPRTLNKSEVEEVQWGETKQERIVDRSPHHKSERHICKGRGCDTAFEKL